MSSNELLAMEYGFLEREDNGFTNESIDKLKALLTIRNDGDMIYICHPKHLFDNMIEDSETKEIEYVDLESINVQRMFDVGDYGHFSMVEQVCNRGNSPLKYIIKKAAHMMKRYKEKGVPQYTYPFVVLEEISHGSEEPTYFVRGIVTCDVNGLYLAFNPLAVKKLPNESVWEKGLRLGDNVVIC